MSKNKTKKLLKYTIILGGVDDLYKDYLCADCQNPLSLQSNFACPKCKKQHFIKVEK